MKYLILGFLLVTLFAQAQKNTYATHTVFVEGLGAGGYYSVNYDKILFVTNKAVYSIRVGISPGYDQVDVNKKGFECLFPMALSRWGAKNKNHHFETGLGATPFWGYLGDGFKVNRGVFWTIDGFVGYRYQRPQGGIMVRAGWAPFYDVSEDWLIPYWVCAGIGYTFKSRHKESEQSNTKTDFIYHPDNPDTHFPSPIKKSLTDSVYHKEWSDSTLWKKLNTIFVGFGGYYAISPNYDKIIYVKRNLKLSASVGFLLLGSDRNTFAYFFPVGVNAFWGTDKHHFQMGIGELWINDNEYPRDKAITPQTNTENIDILTTFLFVGYRYQKPSGGLFIQAGWTPAIAEIRTRSTPSFGVVNPFIAGVCLGYSFLSKEFRNKKSKM